MDVLKFKNFDFLDSFRGLAALAVLLSHTRWHFEDFQFLMSGYYFGVVLFFLLSAFLLTYRLIIQYEAANYNIHKIIQVTINYLITRFFRIYATLVIFCIIYGLLEYFIFGDTDQIKPLLGTLLLNRASIVSGGPSRYGHLWTIPVEVRNVNFLTLSNTFSVYFI
jgi:peptidoglycan/LPS O-acetylase OafA/YrhL